jgi:hypothetical protein
VQASSLVPQQSSRWKRGYPSTGKSRAGEYAGDTCEAEVLLIPNALTQAMIEEGMTRAETVACLPGDDRCYAISDPLAKTRQTCAPTGRGLISWIV